MTETEVAELIDFDHDIECQTARDNCHAEASWRVVQTCCKKEALLCDEHMRSYEEVRGHYVETCALLGWPGRCYYCGQRILPISHIAHKI